MNNDTIEHLLSADIPGLSQFCPTLQETATSLPWQEQRWPQYGISLIFLTHHSSISENFEGS